MSNHSTMRAALLEAHGAPFRVATIARPVAGPGQVLVRIAASGVNPLDTKIHAGSADHAKHPLPAILGIDLAGTIDVVGPDVTQFRVGDEVFGMTGGVGGRQGSLAEYAAVDAALLALKPANLSMREASVVAVRPRNDRAPRGRLHRPRRTGAGFCGASDRRERFRPCV